MNYVFGSIFKRRLYTCNNRCSQFFGNLQSFCIDFYYQNVYRKELLFRDRAIFRQVSSVTPFFRFIFTGFIGSYGYTYKFIPQIVASNVNFTSGTWTMNVLPTGTDDITSISGITIGAVTSLTLAIPSYVNQALTYIKGTTTTASIYYQSET